MHNHDATETAYRNGYEAGYKAASNARPWIPIVNREPDADRLIEMLYAHSHSRVYGKRRRLTDNLEIYDYFQTTDDRHITICSAPDFWRYAEDDMVFEPVVTIEKDGEA